MTKNQHDCADWKNNRPVESLDLDTLRIFVRVAELASFTQAADQLGLARSRVSLAVSRLEARLGARLLQRTTRRVRLTPDGERLLERARAVVLEVDELQALFVSSQTGLRGRLRLDLPNALARDIILPRLPEFMAVHPQLEVGISTTDRRVDLVQEGFDCVLRVGALAESGLVVRPLGALPMRNVASPAYLRRHGIPATLADLDAHRLIHYAGSLSPHGAAWSWLEHGVERSRPMPCAVVVNGTDAYQAACLAGLGLIQAPVLGTQKLVAAGTLVEVLPQYTAPPLAVSLLYAHRRQLPARVRAAMDWLAQVLVPHLAPLAVR